MRALIFHSGAARAEDMTTAELEEAADRAVELVDQLCLAGDDPIDAVEWLAEACDELDRRRRVVTDGQ